LGVHVTYFAPIAQFNEIDVSPSGSVSQKISIQMITLIGLSRLWRWKERNKKHESSICNKTNSPLAFSARSLSHRTRARRVSGTAGRRSAASHVRIDHHVAYSPVFGPVP